MTALDIIMDALTLAGQLGAGRTTGESTEAKVGLRYLNRMLDNWNTNRLAIYRIRQDTYTLTSGTQSYTIGPGGDFNAERPVKIERANIVLSSGSNDDHRQLEVIDVVEWSEIRLPDADSQIPSKLYNDRNVPLSTLRFFPKPDSAYSVILFTRDKLRRFTALNEEFEFPDGYEEAVVYNLAVRLTGVFKKIPLDPDVRHIAGRSLGDIKRVNKVVRTLKTEPLRNDRRGSGYDYRIDE